MSVVVIADTHTLCREALCNYIRHADQDLSVSGFGDYEELRDFLAKGVPDLLLIGHDFPGCDGVFSGVKMAVMVTVPEERMIMNPKLHGVFPKTLSCKSFLKGVYEILEGRTFFPSPEDSDMRPPAPILRMPQDFGLTAREKEVLSYLVKGQSNKDIARALDLQVVTIKLHVRGICRKMKVSNRTQAALAAKENGWG